MIKSSEISEPAGQLSIIGSCNNQRCELRGSKSSYSQDIGGNAIFVSEEVHQAWSSKTWDNRL
jgi:hypothetical protein